MLSYYLVLGLVSKQEQRLMQCRIPYQTTITAQDILHLHLCLTSLSDYFEAVNHSSYDETFTGSLAKPDYKVLYMFCPKALTNFFVTQEFQLTQCSCLLVNLLQSHKSSLVSVASDMELKHAETLVIIFLLRILKRC